MIPEEIIQSRASETFLEKSGWLDIAPRCEVERLFEKFERNFDSYLGQIVAKLGAPAFTEATDPERSAEYYNEAVRLAVWPNGSGTNFLAFGQHDRETPVFVSFGFRSAA